MVVIHLTILFTGRLLSDWYTLDLVLYILVALFRGIHVASLVPSCQVLYQPQ